MRRVLMLMSVVFLGCLLGLAPVGLAQTTSGFTQFAPTGAHGTFANGINTGSGSTCLAPGWTTSPGQHNGQTQGQHVGLCNNPNAVHTGGSQLIVGFYIDAGGMPNSYTLSGTSSNPSFNSLSISGAFMTFTYGVNSAGQIVGAYVDGPPSYRTHGFVLSGGTTTIIDYPHAFYTIASGINNAGQVVGNFQDSTGIHGFVYSGGSSGTFTSFDSTLEPGIPATFATGINASGQIVGYYYTFNFRTRKAFQRTPAGTISELVIPGATDTVARGINTSGQVVGTFTANFQEHGFLYSNGSSIPQQIDIPGAPTTHANGVNDSGTIVGEYVDPTSDTLYGFHMP
jgi:probable HAF family extracellular repeat protein